MSKAKLYEGPVVFVDGVHYPVKDDGWDASRPLRADLESGGYRDAEDGEQLHNDVHHEQLVELDEALGGDA